MHFLDYDNIINLSDKECLELGKSAENYLSFESNRPDLKKQYDIFLCHCYKDAKLISNNGIFLKNVKNLIIYIFIASNQWRKYEEIRNQLINTKIFGKTVMKPYNIKLFLHELIAYDVLIRDDEHIEFERQNFILNKSILPDLYNKSIDKIKYHLNKIFMIK